MIEPSSSQPPASKPQLFRARALEAIDSREGLDELMTIVPSRSLIALIAIGIVIGCATLWAIFGRVPIVERGAGIAISNGGESVAIAKADGVLIADPLPIGTSVQRGTIVARLRTTALEDSPIHATVTGTIVDVHMRRFASVKHGEPIVTIEPAGSSLSIVGFVDFRAHPGVSAGTPARVTPIEDSGIAPAPERGVVVAAGPEPATPARIASILGSGSLASSLNATVREVTIALDEGGPKPTAGSPYAIVLVTGSVSPLAFLFPRER